MSSPFRSEKIWWQIRPNKLDLFGRDNADAVTMKIADIESITAQVERCSRYHTRFGGGVFSAGARSVGISEMGKVIMEMNQ